MTTHDWILAGLLALGLAASTGLNAFLPLLMLAAAAHFHLAGIQLNAELRWLASDTSLVILAGAAAIDMVADKIPAVDHALHLVAGVARPLAGALAATAAFKTNDPAMAAVLGILIGAPVAAGVGTLKAGSRITSSATTAGCGNPILSLIEDVCAFVLVLTGLFAPVLVPIELGLLVLVLWKIAAAAKRKLSSLKRPNTPAATPT